MNAKPELAAYRQARREGTLMTGKEFLLITGQDQRSEPNEWPKQGLGEPLFMEKLMRSGAEN